MSGKTREKGGIQSSIQQRRASFTGEEPALSSRVCSLAGEHGTQLGLHSGSGDGLGDESATVEEGETSPDPQPQQGRKTRREACTCPYCKEGEGR